MKHPGDMDEEEHAAFIQGLMQTYDRRTITNDPRTWPAHDRPLTPAERFFVRTEKEKDERTREAA